MACKFETEIDTVDRNEWYQIMHFFEDANIFQTWDYEAAKNWENSFNRGGFGKL